MAVGKKITDLTASGSLKDTDLAIVHDGNGTKRSTLTQLSEYIGTKISNPNLLINPDFKINQRGQSTYTSNSYTVDRWKLYSGTVTPSLNGVSISLENGGSFTQLFESKFSGVTLSAKVKQITGTIKMYCSDTFVTISSPGVYSISSSNEISQISFYNDSGSKVSADIEWSKLEQGSIATPFVAPNPTEELMKCQRYYRVFSAWKETFTYRGDDKVILFTIPESPMRVNPTIGTTKITILGLQAGEVGTSYAKYDKDISLSYANISNNNILCFANVGSVVSNGGIVILQDDLTLDAEIY